LISWDQCHLPGYGAYARLEKELDMSLEDGEAWRDQVKRLIAPGILERCARPARISNVAEITIYQGTIANYRGKGFQGNGTCKPNEDKRKGVWIPDTKTRRSTLCINLLSEATRSSVAEIPRLCKTGEKVLNGGPKFVQPNDHFIEYWMRLVVKPDRCVDIRVDCRGNSR
jgi:hypothetical protein